VVDLEPHVLDRGQREPIRYVVSRMGVEKGWAMTTKY
jgi:hypothetical protein